MKLTRSILSVGMSSALVLAGVAGVAAPAAAAPNRAAAVGRPAAAQSSALRRSLLRPPFRRLLDRRRPGIRCRWRWPPRSLLGRIRWWTR